MDLMKLLKLSVLCLFLPLCLDLSGLFIAFPMPVLEVVGEIERIVMLLGMIGLLVVYVQITDKKRGQGL